MVKLQGYENLTKKQEDLLYKNYCFGSSGLCRVLVSRDNLSFWQKIYKTDEEYQGSLGLAYKNDDFSLKLKRTSQNNSHCNLAVVLPRLKRAAKLACDYKSNDSSISLEYFDKPSIIGRLSYFLDSKIGKVSLNGVKDNVGGGFELNLCLSENPLKRLAVSLWLNRPSCRLILTHETYGLELGNFICHYYQKISENLRIASKIVSNLKSSTNELELGCEYKIDKDLIFKGKLKSSETMAFSLSKTFNEHIKATIATEFTKQSFISNSENRYKFGFRFDFIS